MYFIILLHSTTGYTLFGFNEMSKHNLGLEISFMAILTLIIFIDLALKCDKTLIYVVSFYYTYWRYTNSFGYTIPPNAIEMAAKDSNISLSFPSK